MLKLRPRGLRWPGRPGTVGVAGGHGPGPDAEADDRRGKENETPRAERAARLGSTIIAGHKASPSSLIAGRWGGFPYRPVAAALSFGKVGVLAGNVFESKAYD